MARAGELQAQQEEMEKKMKQEAEELARKMRLEEEEEKKMKEMQEGRGEGPRQDGALPQNVQRVIFARPRQRTQLRDSDFDVMLSDFSISSGTG